MENEFFEKGKIAAEKFLSRIRKSGADDAVVSLSSHESSQVKFSNSRISNNMIYQSSSLSVFASFGKRIVSTSVKTFDDAALEKSAAFLAKFAKSIEPNPNYMGIAEGPFRYRKDSSLFDSRIEKIGEKIIDYAEKGISIANTGRVKRVAGTAEASVERSYTVSSGGVKCEDRSTGLYFSLRAIVDKDDSAHMVTVSRNLSGFDVKSCAEEACSLANMSLPVEKIHPGKYDLLFYPLPFASLLDISANACSIFDVESGFSFFENKLGKRVAQECFTLVDDASHESGFGSSLCDDEGVPSQRNVLIDKGVLKTYLHNTSTARRYKTNTTASAGLVAPQPANIMLSPGKYSLDEMIKSIKRGIIITNIWYTRFQNYKTGDFSTLPRDKALVVENGRIKCATRGIRIADSMPNLLSRVSAVGKDSRKILGWEVDVPVETPAVLAKGINITLPN
jgi:PmbA protein